MIRATRETFLVADEPVSGPMALAASSARRFSAAWAPIASDTVAVTAAAMAIPRREIGSCGTLITVVPARFSRRAFDWVAPVIPRFEGLAEHVSLNCDQFAAPQQTNP